MDGVSDSMLVSKWFSIPLQSELNIEVPVSNPYKCHIWFRKVHRHGKYLHNVAAVEPLRLSFHVFLSE